MPRAKTLKKSDFIPFAYSLAYGEDTAARPGMVMMRIERQGNVVMEEHMPPGEFLNLASAFENVARGIRELMDKKR